MRQRPVAVVRPFQFKISSASFPIKDCGRLLCLAALFTVAIGFQLSAFGQSDSPSLNPRINLNPKVSPNQDLESGGFLAEITLNSAQEVEQALKRAEQLFEQGAVSGDSGPATFILYGPEVAIFLKENYEQNKAIVDLAARLSAFKIVEIKVCELRLGSLGHGKESIHPFVGTVPYGPGEVDRLIKEEHFSYF